MELQIYYVTIVAAIAGIIAAIASTIGFYLQWKRYREDRGR